jgi:hypothetical protein
MSVVVGDAKEALVWRYCNTLVAGEYANDSQWM